MPRIRDEADREDVRRARQRVKDVEQRVREAQKGLASVKRDIELRRIRYRQRVHDLLSELDLALDLYYPSEIEDVDSIERFRDELKRVRGGKDIASPIIFEPVRRTHAARLSLHRVADATGYTPRFVEEASGPYSGQQSEEIDQWGSVETTCEYCCKEPASTTATVRVRRTGAKQRGHELKRFALCVDCYDNAIADDELP